MALVNKENFDEMKKKFYSLPAPQNIQRSTPVQRTIQKGTPIKRSVKEQNNIVQNKAAQQLLDPNVLDAGLSGFSNSEKRARIASRRTQALRLMSGYANNNNIESIKQAGATNRTAMQEYGDTFRKNQELTNQNMINRQNRENVLSDYERSRKDSVADYIRNRKDALADNQSNFRQDLFLKSIRNTGSNYTQKDLNRMRINLEKEYNKDQFKPIGQTITDWTKEKSPTQYAILYGDIDKKTGRSKLSALQSFLPIAPNIPTQQTENMNYQKQPSYQRLADGSYNNAGLVDNKSVMNNNKNTLSPEWLAAIADEDSGATANARKMRMDKTMRQLENMQRTNIQPMNQAAISNAGAQYKPQVILGMNDNNPVPARMVASNMPTVTQNPPIDLQPALPVATGNRPSLNDPEYWANQPVTDKRFWLGDNKTAADALRSGYQTTANAAQRLNRIVTDPAKYTGRKIMDLLRYGQYVNDPARKRK